jgi:hypothetical protein
MTRLLHLFVAPGGGISDHRCGAWYLTQPDHAQNERWLDAAEPNFVTFSIRSRQKKWATVLWCGRDLITQRV